MAESVDVILPLLRDMRAETTATREENPALHRLSAGRLNKIGATLNGFRHALSADSLLSKLVTGEFEERIETLERKVEALGKQR